MSYFLEFVAVTVVDTFFHRGWQLLPHFCDKLDARLVDFTNIADCNEVVEASQVYLNTAFYKTTLRVQGVGFYENECVSSQMKNCTKVKQILSDYRNESYQDGIVELREADGTISWGWTSSGEWLGYSVTVSRGSQNALERNHAQHAQDNYVVVIFDALHAFCRPPKWTCCGHRR